MVPRTRADATAVPIRRRRFTVDEYHRMGEAGVLTGDSEPQPDLCVLTERADFYARAHPRPRDVLIGIEAMDSSRSYDRTLELPLCAKAELREVWLVDLPAQAIDVYRRPALRGYRDHCTYGRGRTITPLAFAQPRIRVNDILG